MSTTAQLRYSNNFSFAKVPFTLAKDNHPDTSQIVGIVGIPFDAGCSFRTGARFGPSEIRKVSCILREYNIAMKDYPFKDHQVIDFGDLNITPFNLELAVDHMRDGLTEILKVADKYIILGGDHTLSYPSLEAIYNKHGKVCLIHFDAHLDTYDTHFGCKVTHGTPFKRAVDNGFLHDYGKFHIGLRGGTYCEEDLVNDKNLGFVVYPADCVTNENLDVVINEIKNVIGTTKVYISIDIDVADPSIAPGTGTPEMGGFSSKELLSLVRKLKGLNIVGADVVEVCPAYDNSAQTTALLASTLCYELLTLMKS